MLLITRMVVTIIGIDMTIGVIDFKMIALAIIGIDMAIDDIDY